MGTNSNLVDRILILPLSNIKKYEIIHNFIVTNTRITNFKKFKVSIVLFLFFFVVTLILLMLFIDTL